MVTEGVFLLSFMATPHITNAQAIAVAPKDASVEVTPLEQKTVARPGQSVVFTHMVTNSGTNADRYDIQIDNPKDWEFEITPTDIALEPNQATTFILAITVPQTASINEEYKIQVTVQSKEDPEVKGTATDTIIVRYQQYLPLIHKPPAWNLVGTWNDVANGPVISMDVCKNIILAGALNALWEYDTSAQSSNWQKLEVPSSQSSSRLTSIVFGTDCKKAYVSLYGEGVLEGERQDAGWEWKPLSGGANVKNVRSLVLANNILLAGGDSGIAYWENGIWKSVPLPESNPDFTQYPIMHLDITDPTNNTGTVFAAQWVNSTVWLLFNGALPQDGLQPVTRNNAPNLPTIRTISGVPTGGSNNFLVGTSEKLFLVTPAGWQEMSPDGTRSLMVTANNQIYAGHFSFKGVSVASTINGVLSSHNRGWTTPPEVVSELLEGSDGALYAATTTGVWVYR